MSTPCGRGWTEEARMQGYRWEGCQSLLGGSTVSRKTRASNPRPFCRGAPRRRTWASAPALCLSEGAR
eukprot:8703566-Pyramimonas_sp.AAC.1